MFCPNCGTQIADGSVFCPNCGAKMGEAQAQPAQQEQPQYEQPAYQAAVQPAAQPAADSGINATLWLVLSILATLFCCLPTGIVAIIFAAKINGCLSRGDIAGAQDACKKAKTWTIVSAVLALVVVIVYVIIIVATGASIYDELAYMY